MPSLRSVAICSRTKSTVESEIFLHNYFRVLVFKEAPKVLFTGLTRTIGKPRDLEKNVEDPNYFKNIGIDITIPHQETDQFPKNLP
jgi:hypothetical protein